LRFLIPIAFGLPTITFFVLALPLWLGSLFSYVLFTLTFTSIVAVDFVSRFRSIGYLLFTTDLWTGFDSLFGGLAQRYWPCSGIYGWTSIFYHTQMKSLVCELTLTQRIEKSSDEK